MGWLKGEPLAVLRGNTDRYGNRTDAQVPPISGSFEWATPRWNSAVASGRSNMDAETVRLYVERGTDLKPRDMVTRANGEKYVVVGRAQWDQSYMAYTDYDFGYEIWVLEAVNAAKG